MPTTCLVINVTVNSTHKDGCRELYDVAVPDDVVRVQPERGDVQVVLGAVGLKCQTQKPNEDRFPKAQRTETLFC